MPRELRIIKEQIERCGLDLTGLTVITELAGGAYGYNCLLPVIAGAKKVIAVGKTSRYGKYEDIERHTLDICRTHGFPLDRLETVNELLPRHWEQADIVTNSGFVRPITADHMDMMKQTAVIPLMWETWEFRDNDLDLNAALEKNILVLGTDESAEGAALTPYGGMMALKLLMEMNLEVYHNRVILLGGGIIGESMFDALQTNRAECHWFVETIENEYQEAYKNIPDRKDLFAQADAVIFAEHRFNRTIIGQDTGLDFPELARLNPELKIGIVAGNIDIDGLKESGLYYYPHEIKSFGYMSFQAHQLGPAPIIELFAAGIRVGQVMARCREQGKSLEETVEFTLHHSPAMDFPGQGYMGKYNRHHGKTS